jgi:hypothetical protein
MKNNYRSPHVEKVDVPRPHVLRLTFDDGLVRELQSPAGSNEGTAFAPLTIPRTSLRSESTPRAEP